MRKTEIKINVGCGPTGQICGFDNLDNSPMIVCCKIPLLKKLLFRHKLITEHQFKSDWSNVIRCDASKKLPYKDRSVSKIYASHFLEHLPKEKGINFLKECHRILKPDGVIRLVVPDLLFHAERYVTLTKNLVLNSTEKDDRRIHDTFLNTVYGAYLKKKRFGAEHYYMYDLPTLTFVLKSLGFQSVKKFDFKEGDDQELRTYDSRPEDSLHIEVRKVRSLNR